MKNLLQEEWKAQLSNDKNSIIIDTRTLEEYKSGIIENAIVIDFLQQDLFLEEVNKLDKTKTYYIYCRSGNRSGKACLIMEGLGFKESFNLMGGINDWKGEKVSLS
tara:strand:+ start:676 stop:993 length:318 start_codon:yes stop_codon:yes gene_type:complete